MRALAQLLDLLFPPSVRMRTVRQVHEEDVLRLIEPRAHACVTSLLPYEGVVRDVITRAKFENDVHAQTLLARALESFLPSYIAEENAFLDRPITIVPVPLSRTRYRERGYNQVVEVLRKAALPYAQVRTDIVRRVRHTAAQTTLGRRDRLANMEHAFRAQTCDPTHLYIGIDDVATTGATLKSLETALREAGATEVRLLALAAPLEHRR